MSNKEIPPKEGRDDQKVKWYVPATEPIIKKNKVITILVLPLPAVNKVPEPQPPPNCMARPNIKDPITTDKLTGAIAPTIVPSYTKLLEPMTKEKTIAAKASIKN